VRACNIEVELGPVRAQAEEAGDQRIALGDAVQLVLELADPLPSSRQLVRQTLPVPHTHLTLTIGRLATVLENPSPTRGGA